MRDGAPIPTRSCVAAALAALTLSGCNPQTGERPPRGAATRDLAPPAPRPDLSPPAPPQDAAPGAADAASTPAPASTTPESMVKLYRADGMPRWMSRSRQPKGLPGYYARALRSPPALPFDGYIACKIAVSGKEWDFVPLGPDWQGLPDIRVKGPTDVVRLPDNRSGGYAGFPFVHLDAGSTLKLEIDDVDDLVADTIGVPVLSAAHGFPLEEKTKRFSVSCVGVPLDLYAAELAAVRQTVDKTMALAEAPRGPLDLRKPEATRKAIDAARDAVRELAMYVSDYTPELIALVDRLENAHARWQSELAAASDASIAAAPAPTEWHELPSARIRAVPGGTSPTFEIEARKTLRYDWRPEPHFSAFKFWLVDGRGDRRGTPMVYLGTGAKPRAALFTTSVPPGKSIQLSIPGVIDVRYVVFAEGETTYFFPAYGS